MELKGEIVVLRPVREDDVDDLVRMFTEPAVAEWWPRYDRQTVEEDLLHNDEGGVTVYAIDVDGEVAGVIQTYEEADPDYRAAEMDIAVATEWHGRGIAVDALRTLARDLIEQRGHHHLLIDPAAGNARAIACYRKIGFRPVGVLRQTERGADGTWHDALQMDLLVGELT